MRKFLTNQINEGGGNVAVPDGMLGVVAGQGPDSSSARQQKLMLENIHVYATLETVMVPGLYAFYI